VSTIVVPSGPRTSVSSSSGAAGTYSAAKAGGCGGAWRQLRPLRRRPPEHDKHLPPHNCVFSIPRLSNPPPFIKSIVPVRWLLLSYFKPVEMQPHLKQVMALACVLPTLLLQICSRSWHLGLEFMFTALFRNGKLAGQRPTPFHPHKPKNPALEAAALPRQRSVRAPKAGTCESRTRANSQR
jgi:hypothetical protein